jgi:hypothetical protein
VYYNVGFSNSCHACQKCAAASVQFNSSHKHNSQSYKMQPDPKAFSLTPFAISVPDILKSPRPGQVAGYLYKRGEKVSISEDAS